MLGHRGVRRGSWNDTDNLSSWYRPTIVGGATAEGFLLGFRVASIPEPGTELLMLVGMPLASAPRYANASLVRHKWSRQATYHGARHAQAPEQQRMWPVWLGTSVALLILPISGAKALSFRVDFSAQFSGFANPSGDGEGLLEIPSDGTITGSYFYSDSPLIDRTTGTGPETRDMQFHDAHTYATVEFVDESVTIFSELGSGVGNFSLANDHFFDGREDPSVEPCTLAFACGFEDRYRVVYQDGARSSDYWNHLIFAASATWDVDAPASTLFTGLDFTDIPELSRASSSPDFFLWIIRPSGSVQVTGELTGLSLEVVPEPSTGALVGVGLGLLVASRRRRSRRLR